MRVLAIDWSGRVVGERRHIWLAEAHRDTLVRLEAGRSRAEVAAHLVELAAAEPELVVGIDFSFSLPAWFLVERHLASAPDLWRLAATDGERWLTDGAPPFWGLPGTTRPTLPEHLRVTEASIAVGGIRPKSTFQISGAGSVGAGSIRGFPVLHTLRDAGFSVWPFDDACPPVVVEVWPRLLTGPVVKTDGAARASYLDDRFPMLDRALRDLAVGSDDAFDAAVSALVMAEHVDALVGRPATEDPTTRREGWVWCPPAPAS
ncbi:MAG TPA: hypothetical protein VFZ17_10040 [Acidimicrobiia bacterium]|nr:hypothetical protein [Acidimicrobiia bacterium]